METSKVKMELRGRLCVGIAAAALFAVMGCESMEQVDSMLEQASGSVLEKTLGKVSDPKMRSMMAPGAQLVMDEAVAALLSEAEQRQVQQESAGALSDAPDGKPVEWESPESGATATITPSRTRRERREVVVVRDEKVSAPQDLELLGEPYRAKSAANLRAGPTTDTARVGGLASGEQFTAVGRTAGSWILVGKGGRSVGYVHSSLVQPAPTAEASAGLREPVNLDDMELEEGVVAEPVVATTSCRSVQVVVTNKKGKTATDSMDACRAPDGAWEL